MKFFNHHSCFQEVLVDGVSWLLKTHAMKLSLIGDDKVGSNLSNS